MERPPPPGVSAIGIEGSRKPLSDTTYGAPAGEAVEGAPARKPTAVRTAPVQKKRLQSAPKPPIPGADPIDVTKGRRVVTGLPTGVSGTVSDIVELPMPKTRSSSKNTVSFHSVDGNVYTFRVGDGKKKFAWANELAIFTTLVEVAKGGDALNVLTAFNLHYKDEGGQQYMPVPEEILASLGVREPAASEVSSGADLEEEAPFSLGE